MSLLSQINDAHIQTPAMPLTQLKLTVNLPQLKRMAQVDPAKQLASLYDTLKAVLASKTPTAQSMRVCEDLCALGHSQQAFAVIQQHISRSAQFRCMDLYQGLFGQQTTPSVLEGVHKFWSQVCSETQLLHENLQWIERQILLQSMVGRREVIVQPPTIWGITNQTVKAYLTQSKGERILSKLRDEMLQEISRFRLAVLGQGPAYSAKRLVFLKTAVDLLLAVELYEGTFEDHFIQQSAAFYSELSAVKLSELGAAKYINFAHELIQTESKFTSMYLADQVSFTKLVETLETVLITRHKEQLLADFGLILGTEHCLRTLFEFVKLTGLERDFASAFKSHVVSTAQKIFDKPTDSYQKLTELSEFKLACDQIQVALKTETLRLHQKIAFEQFVNAQNQNQFAQHLVHYIDQLLQRKQQTYQHIQFQFHFLHNLDVFEKKYLQMLANRIFTFQFDLKEEQQVADLFISDCCENFKNSFGQMLQDVRTSLPTPTVTCVCGEGKTWSMVQRPQEPRVVPPALTTMWDEWQQQYRAQFKPKNIELLFDQGWFVLQATFSKANAWEIEATPAQALILLQFNGKAARQGPTALVKSTSLTAQQVQQAIAQLIQANLIRAVAPGSTRKASAETTYEVNEDLQQKHRMVLTQRNEVSIDIDQQKKVEQQISNDRKFYVDSVLFKIMKQRLTMSLQDLLDECVSLLNFPVAKETLAVRVTDLAKRLLVAVDGDTVKFLP